MGLGVLAMARLLLGAELPVYVADLAPRRLALAERLGGIPIDLRGEDLAAGLRRAGAARVDLAVDTGGRGAARQALLAVLAGRGVLVCV